MPTNKNAQLRYQILDRCLSNRRRRYTIDDLLETVNDALYDMYGSKGQIQMRQIRDDIKFMRDSESYRAPIEAIPFDGRKCYYRYSDPHFSIFNNELSVEEVSRLRSTIKMLGMFRGMPGNGWLEEVVSTLEYRFGVKANNENAVSFEQNEQLKGLAYLSTIIDATVSHQPLQLLYRSYKGYEEKVTIHPYHVKEFNNRWFLFGLEETTHGNRIANRALDRIESLSRSEARFIPNTSIDFGTYFKDVVGVTVPEQVQIEHVVLRFKKERFPYIVSKPIHPSQRVLSEEGCTLQIDVCPNNELTSLIFSFCPDVEVMEPAWFRTEIVEKMKANIQKYISEKPDGAEGK